MEAKAPKMKLTKKAESSETAEAIETASETKALEKPEAEGKLLVAAHDLIKDTVQEIDGMKEEKAFAQVPKLLDSIDQDYFKLGGVLSKVQNEGWFMNKGYETFKAYVEAECNIQYRKAMYLIQIYNGLVASGVEWDQVKHLGWTKLKELATILTVENADEWVSLAEDMTVLQLQEHIKQSTAAEHSADSASSDTTAKQTTTMTFKLHQDQKDTVREALDKAKHEAGTEFDSVALEAMSIGYLGGESKVAKVSLVDLLKTKSAEEVLEAFGTVFPDVKVTAELP